MKDKDLTLMLHLDSPSREPASPEAAEAIRVAALRGFAPWAVRHSRVAALRRYACATVLSLLLCLGVVRAMAGVLPMISSDGTPQAVAVGEINYLLSC